jgi:hypothetical protein
MSAIFYAHYGAKKTEGWLSHHQEGASYGTFL